MSQVDLDQLIAKQFGVATESLISPAGSVVNIAVTQVVGNDPRRLALIIINLSVNDVFVAPDRQVSSTRGIKINAGGGSVSFIFSEDFHIVGRAFFATATVDASAVTTIQVLARRRLQEPAV